MSGAAARARVKVLFFAKARELAGLKESELELPARLNSSELKARLVRDFSLESIRDIFILALNEEFVDGEVELDLEENDEIAVIPPLSGGVGSLDAQRERCLLLTGGDFDCGGAFAIEDTGKMASTKDFVGLTPTKLNINDIIETVVSANCGAVSTFIGTTRDNFEQKKVVKLEYEAYEPMAVKELQAVCNKVRSQWNVEKIAIYHRLGEVPVMEASIVIAISSSHRQESLQAVQFAIDAVKTSVPIWKKEIYENAEPQWKANKECSWAANNTNMRLEKIHEVKEDQFQVDNSNVVVDDIGLDVYNVYETVEINSEFVSENDSGQGGDSIEDFVIDPDQVQIKADAAELDRRIKSFISRKREQVNLVNMQEFGTYSGPIDDGSDDATCVCARVNATLIRRKDSRSHVKVHRVYNQWSQQNIKSNIPIKLKSNASNYPPALEERLSTTEKVLGINKPVPKDVYERIKKIEDRLLFLESISPEYKDLWAIDDCDSVNSDDENPDTKLNMNSVRKRTYSSTELNSKLHELEDRYGKRTK